MLPPEPFEDISDNRYFCKQDATSIKRSVTVVFFRSDDLEVPGK
jgi:hypothetical protein